MSHGREEKPPFSAKPSSHPIESIRLVEEIMKSSFLLLLLFLVVALGASFRSHAAGLKHHFYKKSCPQAEQIVQYIIWNHVANNSELPAKFLRMFFHDCFVRGCDASVLINSTANNTAEKDAIPNSSLAGFDVIDEVKTALEKACPDTVSCADIIALAARDSVSFQVSSKLPFWLKTKRKEQSTRDHRSSVINCYPNQDIHWQFKKSLWKVQTGRRDGIISLASKALANIPSPFFNFTTLASSFANKTLDVEDLVVLSGIALWKHIFS